MTTKYKFLGKREYTDQMQWTFLIPEGRLTLKRTYHDSVMVLSKDGAKRAVYSEDLSAESVRFIEKQLGIF
jgi:hypothetical protein